MEHVEFLAHEHIALVERILKRKVDEGEVDCLDTDISCRKRKKKPALEDLNDEYTKYYIDYRSKETSPTRGITSEFLFSPSACVI